MKKCVCFHAFVCAKMDGWIDVHRPFQYKIRKISVGLQHLSKLKIMAQRLRQDI